MQFSNKSPAMKISTRISHRCRYVIGTSIMAIAIIASVSALREVARMKVDTIFANQPDITITSAAAAAAATTAAHEHSNTPSCCVMCTTPEDTCCLSCADVSSPREHDLLMAAMEGLTHHIMDKHNPNHDSASTSTSTSSQQQNQPHHKWLQTRAWEGNSHIGNRPKQATYYYDWVRSLTPVDGGDKVKHVCEIGMNGGHSALIFLAALAEANADDYYMNYDLNGGDEKNATITGPRARNKLTMFDFCGFEYSGTTTKYIEALYPGQFTLHTGNSRLTVPSWTTDHATTTGKKCDVFSIDGDHTYDGARIDISNAAKATKKGGRVILDDMNPGGPTRQAFDSALEAKVLVDKRCVENVNLKIGYVDRFDVMNARNTSNSWCTAIVA